MKPLHTLTDDELAPLIRQAQALPDAPEALIRAAIDAWPGVAARRPLAALQAAAEGLLQQISAVLSFDSWATPALASGLRSTAADTRHLLFSAQGRDIDLRLLPEGAEFALVGQVLGPDDSGWVELTPEAAPEAARRVALDDMGEFRLPAVAAGRHQLVLRLGQDLITLPPLDVGQRGDAA